jgi:alkylhydroperoxidase family enzyme
MLRWMSWLPAHGPGRDDFERSFALRPDLFEAWKEFAGIFWEKRLVDPVLLELCRLRVAQLHGAAYPLSTRMREATEAGLDEPKIARLASWWKQPGFSDLERACLRFAEQFVLDAKAMSDEEARPVVTALGDAGTVAFVEALAIFDGLGRFCRMLDVQPVGESA